MGSTIKGNIMILKLDIKEALSINKLLPKKGGILTMLTIKSLQEKILLTDEEIKKSGIIENNNNGANSITWKNNIEKEIEITEPEKKILDDEIKSLDDQKEITIDILNLIKKINKL